MKKNKERKIGYFLYDFIRVTAALPGLIWYRYKKYYESENAKKKVKGGALVVANHSTFSDPIHLIFGFWYRRTHFVVRKEFFDGGSAWWFKRFHCIPIDRATADISCFREVKKHLDSGKLVAIFPEGQVVQNEDNKFQAFKSGMVLMAMRSNCPIVPVYLAKRTKWWQRQKMVIGEAIDVKQLLGKMPSLAEIDNVSKLVFEHEERLKQIYEEKTQRRKK